MFIVQVFHCQWDSFVIDDNFATHSWLQGCCWKLFWLKLESDKKKYKTCATRVKMIGIWSIAKLQRNKIQNQLGRISQLVLTSIKMSRRNGYGVTAMGRCSDLFLKASEASNCRRFLTMINRQMMVVLVAAKFFRGHPAPRFRLALEKGWVQKWNKELVIKTSVYM